MGKLGPLTDLHESTQEEKEINCLELQIFLLHSMFDTEKKGFNVILLVAYRLVPKRF